MPDVLVRQWSDHCHAAYLDLGLAHPVFVGCEATADGAREWGQLVLADEDGSLKNRCGISVSAGVSDLSEHACAVEFGLPNSDGPRSVTTPAHLPLTRPGASS